MRRRKYRKKKKMTGHRKMFTSENEMYNRSNQPYRNQKIEMFTKKKKWKHQKKKSKKGYEEAASAKSATIRRENRRLKYFSIERERNDNQMMKASKMKAPHRNDWKKWPQSKMSRKWSEENKSIETRRISGYEIIYEAENNLIKRKWKAAQKQMAPRPPKKNQSTGWKSHHRKQYYGPIRKSKKENQWNSRKSSEEMMAENQWRNENRNIYQHTVSRNRERSVAIQQKSEIIEENQSIIIKAYGKKKSKSIGEAAGEATKA